MAQRLADYFSNLGQCNKRGAFSTELFPQNSLAEFFLKNTLFSEEHLVSTFSASYSLAQCRYFAAFLQPLGQNFWNVTGFIDLRLGLKAQITLNDPPLSPGIDF